MLEAAQSSNASAVAHKHEWLHSLRHMRILKLGALDFDDLLDVSNFSGLVELQMATHNIPDISSCHHIHTLNLTARYHYTSTSSHFSDQDLTHFAATCIDSPARDSLQSLSLRTCTLGDRSETSYTDVGLMRVLSTFTRIASLDVSGSAAELGFGVMQAMEPSIRTLVAQRTNIWSASLQNLPASLASLDVSNNDFEADLLAQAIFHIHPLCHSGLDISASVSQLELLLSPLFLSASVRLPCLSVLLWLYHDILHC